MKIRNGFVSNSSTSSFVIIGFKLDMAKLNRKKLLKAWQCKDVPETNFPKHTNHNDFNDYFFDKLYSRNDCIVASMSLYVGKKICVTTSSDDGGLDTTQTDIESIINQLETIRKIYDVSKDQKPMLYTGQRPC